MKKLLISLILVLGIFSLITAKADAWFGADETPGWPVTSSGLKGEIQLPVYKFAPDFYNIGDTVNITVKGTNTTGSDVNSHYFFVIHKVMESPTGTNISDGTPTTPGVNENDLYNNFTGGHDVETFATSADLGNQTFLANSQHSFGGSYITTEVGYFKFDFVDSNPSEYSLGSILASGFFRVLRPSSTPTATPVATPTPAPIVTATPTDNNSNNNTSTVNDGGDGLGCATHDCSGNKVPQGQVLGVSTMAKTGSFAEGLNLAIMALGGILSVFGIKNFKKAN